MRNVLPLLIGALSVFTSCVKEKNPISVNTPSPGFSIENAMTNDDLMALRSQIMRSLLLAAEDSLFRTIVLNECLKQTYDDYYVRLEDLSNELKNFEQFKELQLELLSFSSEIKRYAPDKHAILFYPKAETIEEVMASGGNPSHLQKPIGVYQEVFLRNYDSPGYVLNENQSLIFHGYVSEVFAWENDVWVIGEDENYSKVSNQPSFDLLESVNAQRTNGRAEFGGIIQITNLNEVEHWTSGKVELSLRVFSSSGVLISHRDFDRRARRNFQNQAWLDFNHFICNWNTGVFGNWMFENWIERDGGFTNSVTLSFPPPPGTSGPGITTTFPSRDGDDNLGLATVQFTDNLSQVYNISHANIRRK